ncbi:MAG TPA: thioredoxin domain-containing protein [Blastocatellia bacterium]|nr:thioredoxin domain-containing protein [Blastocatellia bacterium]
MSTEQSNFTNRLINETSPYLVQHAHNPVDWYPWCDEAFEKARQEDKPVLLSVGYAACHWCHVLAHESFENEAIAKLMNELFINIKVDREERPDIDSIYMNALQMMTGHGGWPMTMFLTPDGIPFYGGTYYPPEDRRGMPGFPRVLISIAEAYKEQRAQIASNANTIIEQLNRLNEFTAADELNTEILDQAASGIMRGFDTENGGFGRAPKFPPAMVLSFLLRQSERTNDKAILAAIELTLIKMAHGGMYDQLGGGFHRYSVDEKWLIPHFEKMLYDNALLSRMYLDAYLVTGKEFYRQITTEILDYVVREMTDASGGFYSSQDADSEGEEGKFFAWRPEEIIALLGEEDGRLFNRYFDVSEYGNFEHGTSALHIDTEVTAVAKIMNVTPERLTQAITRGKQVLFEAREQRIKPARDEKILTAWNGLMLRSFAEAARVLKRDDYLQIAVRNAEFLTTQLKRDGRLLRTHKDGINKLNAYQEDYAYLIDGLLALYEATFDERWFVEARELADTMIALFWDENEGGFFFTSHDHEQLIARAKESYDNATPSGNSVAAFALQRLALFTNDARYHDYAERTLKLLANQIARFPNAFGHLLCALDLYLSNAHEIAIIGHRDADDAKALIDAVFSRYVPNKVVACATPNEASAIQLLADRTQVEGKATAYVCHNFYCEAPVTEEKALINLLGQ